MLTLWQALLASAGLTSIMILCASSMRSRMWTFSGMKIAFGNRDRMPEPSPAVARADRAAKNMLENMVLFVAVAAGFTLSGHAAGRASLGATIFFWARVVYFP